jgi:MFS superfamily sulfate permease-like transporter
MAHDSTDVAQNRACLCLYSFVCVCVTVCVLVCADPACGVCGAVALPRASMRSRQSIIPTLRRTNKAGRREQLPFLLPPTPGTGSHPSAQAI